MLTPMQFIVNQMSPDRPVLYKPRPMRMEPKPEPRPKMTPKTKRFYKPMKISLDEVVKLRAAGAGWSELEAKAGMSVTGIAYRLKKAGKYVPQRRLITEAEISQAIQMRSEGKSWPEVGEALGRSRYHIAQVVRDREAV